jgi:fatty-acyl-CoA synthase
LPPAETLPELLERARLRPEAGIRLLDRRENEEWISWGEIARGADSVAAGLAAAGVAAGDVVGVVFPTSRAFFEAFFGCLLAGAVPAALPPASLLGPTGDYRRRIESRLRCTGALLALADARGKAALAGLPVRTLAELSPGGGRPPHRARPGDVAMVQFSSGSTGEPRPVALSHRAVLAQVSILEGFWRDSPGVEHRAVSWLPLHHDMGLVGCVLPSLSRGREVTLIPPEAFAARPALWLRAISRYRATVSAAPTFGYALAAGKITDEEIAGIDLSCWRSALCGAEPVSPEVLRRFARRFASNGFRPEALAPVYGLAEAGLAVTFPPLGREFKSVRFDRDALTHGLAKEDPAGREIVSLGAAVPGFSVGIRGEGGRGLPGGSVGHVVVTGPSLMEGYVGAPEETRRALLGGWLETGDMGFLHGGELYLTGREKDVVVLRGRKHAPEEIEEALGDIAGIRPGGAAAASHLPEGADGERLVIFVERDRGAAPQESARIASECRRAVIGACAIIPDDVVVLPPGGLPRTTSGKPRRAEALRVWLAGEIGGDAG